MITALEGHEYQLLKDKQQWCAFDHQSIQTDYAVKCKPSAEILKDKYKMDYFEIIGVLPGDQAAQTCEEWNQRRTNVNKPIELTTVALAKN